MKVKVKSCTHRLVDQSVTGVGAVEGLIGATAAAAVQGDAAGAAERADGLGVFFGDLHAHLSGLTRGPLDLLQDD